MCRLRRRCAPCRSVVNVLSVVGLGLASAGCAMDHAAIVETGGLSQRFSLAMLAADISGPLSNAEAEAVIAHAIAEHEMRRP